MKRYISLCIVIVMIMSLMSVNIFAADGSVQSNTENNSRRHVITLPTVVGSYYQTVDINIQFVTEDDPDDKPFIIGDVNDDGLVNSTDDVLLKRYLANLKVDYINLKAADLNSDGYIGSTDSVLLLRILAGLDPY